MHGQPAVNLPPRACTCSYKVCLLLANSRRHGSTINTSPKGSDLVETRPTTQVAAASATQFFLACIRQLNSNCRLTTAQLQLSLYHGHRLRSRMLICSYFTQTSLNTKQTCSLPCHTAQLVTLFALGLKCTLLKCTLLKCMTTNSK